MATPLPQNRATFTLEQLTMASGGRALSTAEGLGTSVVTDSRAVTPGSIFVALRGEQHDAHAYLDQVFAQRPFAVVVSQEVTAPAGVAVIRVDDTLRALGDLARAHASRLRSEGALRVVIGVTGSVGKTSTKEMLALGLRSGRPATSVAATAGNLNNLIGVPMTLLALTTEVEIAIIEMGMNTPGEIARLTEIATPDLGVVTSVAPAHTEGVTSLAHIAEEKSALLRALPAHALGAVAPADDDAIEPFLVDVKAPLLRAGRAEHADVRLVDRTTRWDGTYASVTLPEPIATGSLAERTIRFHLPLFGEGAAKNAATAIATALLLGGPDEARRVASALLSIAPTAGRLAFLRGTRSTVLLDDSYNASPRAMDNALETAAELAHHTGGRLVAVLGDMLELGALESELHARVGETAARMGASLIVTCGARMRHAAEEAREMGADFVVELDDPLDAVEVVRQFVQRGDVIVVKGSRGLRMERVVSALTSRGSSPPFDLSGDLSNDGSDDGEVAA
jgi:UDP-N-acetylmuramoyl-tripeptide--D-alanyl-D-alanine ligase